jgi:hypothetical protein
MVKVQGVALFCDVSTAVHVTVWTVLAAKVEPEAWLQLDEAMPMLSVAMVAKVAAIPLALVATRFWGSGQVISGGVVSVKGTRHGS